MTVPHEVNHGAIWGTLRQSPNFLSHDHAAHPANCMRFIFVQCHASTLCILDCGSRCGQKPCRTSFGQKGLGLGSQIAGPDPVHDSIRYDMILNSDSDDNSIIYLIRLINNDSDQ